MKIQEIANRLHIEFGITKARAKRFIKNIADEVISEIKEKGYFHIPHLGSIKTNYRYRLAQNTQEENDASNLKQVFGRAYVATNKKRFMFKPDEKLVEKINKTNCRKENDNV